MLKPYNLLKIFVLIRNFYKPFKLTKLLEETVTCFDEWTLNSYTNISEVWFWTVTAQVQVQKMEKQDQTKEYLLNLI